jgi:hypothetical protein
MQTTTEQDICALLKGIAISCIRKRDLKDEDVRDKTGKILEDIATSPFISMVSWFKILNDLGYDVCLHIKGDGERHGQGILTLKIDDQEF